MALPLSQQAIRSSSGALQHHISEQQRALDAGFSGASSMIAPCLIGIFSQITQELEELSRLTDEQSIVRKTLHRVHRRALRRGGSNDRAWGKLAAQEYSGFRHDQVGLK